MPAPTVVETKTIVVADDTAFVRDRFRSALESAGHRAITVASGSELLATLRAAAQVDLVVLDLRLPQARGVELHERLRTGRRGLFVPAYLVAAIAGVGHPALGWPDAGYIGVGARADLVTIALDTVRTAGCRPDSAVFAATAADVRRVMVDGREVVRDGHHLLVDDPARDLATAITAVLP